MFVYLSVQSTEINLCLAKHFAPSRHGLKSETERTQVNNNLSLLFFFSCACRLWQIKSLNKTQSNKLCVNTMKLLTAFQLRRNSSLSVVVPFRYFLPYLNMSGRSCVSRYFLLSNFGKYLACFKDVHRVQPDTIPKQG